MLPTRRNEMNATRTLRACRELRAADQRGPASEFSVTVAAHPSPSRPLVSVRNFWSITKGEKDRPGYLELYRFYVLKMRPLLIFPDHATDRVHWLHEVAGEEVPAIRHVRFALSSSVERKRDWKL